MMETIRVEILNQKALKLLKNLEELDLIAISKEDGDSFTKILKKLRSKSDQAPSLEEITKEVKLVRNKRYGHK